MWIYKIAHFSIQINAHPPKKREKISKKKNDLDTLFSQIQTSQSCRAISKEAKNEKMRLRDTKFISRDPGES